MNVRVHLGKSTQEFLGNGKVEGLAFADGRTARGRHGRHLGGDPAARRAGPRLRAGSRRPRRRGGRRRHANVRPATSSPSARSPCIADMVYGLVAPGYEMAEVVAANLVGAGRTFSGFDMSTKLKLMGVDVASFGDPFTERRGARALTFRRSVRGRLQEARVRRRGHPPAGRHAGRRRLGLRHFARPIPEREPLPVPPGDLLSRAGGAAARRWADAQVCSCNNVGEARSATRSATGSCRPSRRSRRARRPARAAAAACRASATCSRRSSRPAGARVDHRLCEHFAYSRQELFQIVDDQGDPDVRRT